MGTFFRTMDQSGVDVEDLYHMLKAIPIVQEKENAVDFQYKEGLIEFKNIGYTHYIMDQNTKEEDGKDKKKIDSKEAKQEAKVQEKRLF